MFWSAKTSVRMLRDLRKRPRRAGRARRTLQLERLERRELLSVAPLAVDDSYDLDPQGQLVVGVPSERLADDESVQFFPRRGDPDFVLNVAGGQRVTAPGWVELGSSADTYGEVAVSDPGSMWTVGNWLEVGDEGYGSMSITNGGAVHTTYSTRIGVHAGADGYVTLAGRGSRWTTVQFVSVANGGAHGVLTISDGASFSNGNWIDVGADAGSVGVAILTGPESRWTNSGAVSVGDGGGRGLLKISDGAVLAANNWASVGRGNGSVGNVVLSGGAQWNLANHLTVGGNGGRGTLKILDGSKLQSNNWAEIGEPAGSVGKVLVSGPGSLWTNQNWLDIGADGEGTLAIADGGVVQSLGPTTVFAGGRLTGDGTLRSNVVSRGLIAPGTTRGVLAINGRLVQEQGAQLVMEIEGNTRGTQYDGLDLTGEFAAGGKLVVSFLRQFAPKAGDSYDLVLAPTITGSFAEVEIVGLLPEFQYSLSYDGGVVRLTALNDGIPTPQPMIPVPIDPGVLGNDESLDGDRLEAILVERPAHGDLTLYSNGAFCYVPAPDTFGTDTFQYIATDGFTESNVATVTIRDPRPVAVDDAFTTAEDTRLRVAATDGVLANDSSDTTPHDRLTAVLVAGPEHGELEINADGSFAYRPARDFNGTDSFTYRATDGTYVSQPAKVALTVTPVNDRPVAQPDQKVAQCNTPLVFPASDLVANDTDVDGDRLTVVSVRATGATHGTVALENDTVTYTSRRNFTCRASFKYVVSDGHGGTTTGTVGVLVQRVEVISGRVFGRGTLDREAREFDFSVRAALCHGEPLYSGRLSFSDEPNHLTLRSTAITSVTIDRDKIHATFTGRARVNGREGYTFTVEVEDRGGPGRRDRFRIQIAGPDGFRYDSLAFALHEGRIDRGGNIAIQMPAAILFSPFPRQPVQKAANDLALMSVVQEGILPTVSA